MCSPPLAVCPVVSSTFGGHVTLSLRVVVLCCAVSGSGRALLDVALLDALDNKFALAKSAVACIERVENLLERMSQCDDDYSAIDTAYKSLWKDLEETVDDALALRRKILMEMQDEITPESPVLKSEREMSLEALLGIAEPRVKMLIRYASIASRLAVCKTRIAEFTSDESVCAITVGAAHALSEAEAGSASVMKLLTSMYVGGAGPSEPAWDQFLQHVVVSEPSCRYSPSDARCHVRVWGTILLARLWNNGWRTWTSVCLCGSG
jgi:hypothetical protein